jgi:hypothetical protein
MDATSGCPTSLVFFITRLTSHRMQRHAVNVTLSMFSFIKYVNTSSASFTMKVFHFIALRAILQKIIFLRTANENWR